MKYRFLALVLLGFAACAHLENPQEIKDENNPEESLPAYEEGEVRVLFSEEIATDLAAALECGSLVTKSSGLNDVFSDLGITSARRLFAHGGEFEPRMRRAGLHRWYVVEFDKNIPVTKAEADFSSIPGVEIVEPVGQAKLMVFDDLNSRLWGLYNESYPGIDINVMQVWENYTVGSQNVIVSVVDAGIDLNHEDLAANCAKDGHFNFVDNNAVITPSSHGTHVAGTIAAVSNNGKGVAGIAGGDFKAGKPGVTLLSCQTFKDLSDGTSRSGDFAAAIVWGANHGAVISQNSWGYSFDANNDGRLTGDEVKNAMAATIRTSDKEAIDYFIEFAGCDNDGNQRPDSPMKGGVVIFAAGNDNIANGAPANYEPILSVGAIDPNGAKASYSNYGDWVDICAPGTDIYSTVPGNSYSMKSGTSMACPHVSGVAALVLSYCGGQGFTNEMLIDKLLSGASDFVVPSSAKIGKLVDAMGAVTYGSNAEPEPVTDLKAAPKANSIQLKWTVGKDTENKPVYGYYVFYSKNREAVEKAVVGNAGDAKMDIVNPARQAGELAEYTIGKLEFETEYFVKMVAYSYNMKLSEPTAVTAVVTEANLLPVINLDGPESLKLKSDASIDLFVTFSEPDGHSFTISYESGSAADSFTDNLDGRWRFSVVASKAEPGVYVAKIKAEDEFGGLAVLPITYEILANRPPKAVGTLDDVLMKKVSEEVVVDISKCFVDEDEEQLRYECELSNPKVAHASSKGDKLYITATGLGSTEVTLYAKDAKGEKASVKFRILVRNSTKAMDVYPNPVKDVMYVATETEGNADISIVTSSGKRVFEQSSQSSLFNPAKLDLSALAPGVYAVIVRTGGKEFKETVVKL